MLEQTYIEWIFAGVAVSLYLFIWMNGYRRIKKTEQKKREGK